MIITHNLPIVPGSKPLVERVMNTAWYVRSKGYLELDRNQSLLDRWDGSSMRLLYDITKEQHQEHLYPANELDKTKLQLMHTFHRFWQQVKQQDQIILVKLLDWTVYETFIRLLFQARPRTIILGDNREVLH